MRPSELQRYSAHTTWQKKEEMKKKKTTTKYRAHDANQSRSGVGASAKKNEDHISISVNAAHKM